MTEAPSRFGWSQIEPLLADALARAPEARRAWLEQACVGEPGLADEVWQLAIGATSEDGFLESPWHQGEEASALYRAGKRVGRYELLERIGTGGMGSVWLAERVDGHYRQRVALKLVKRGMDTEAVVRRFRLERQVLADLEHPYIARLLDGGATEEGLPFLVMEHVDGTPLLRYCEKHRLGLRERLEIFSRVCEAVGFAHEQGIIHCDLKPSNVLLDAQGTPKLLDFGIAKVLSPDAGTRAHDRTRTGDRFLSPRYASPEQIRGQEVERASDVFALGIVLYELLTNVHPHGQVTTTWRAFEDEVVEREPVAPSKAVLMSPPPEPKEGRTHVSRAMRGDVDTIVLTALRKEPERRYANAHALGTDITRFLMRKPVLARPDTAAYRARKFLERHRGLVAGSTAFVVLLMAALAVTWSLYVDSERARERARRAAHSSGLAAAESALRSGNAAEARASLERVPEDMRGWTWHHLSSRLDRAKASVPVAGMSPLAIDADGRHLAVSAAGELRVLDATSLEPLRRHPVPEDWGVARSLALAPDGRSLAATYEHHSRAVVLGLQDAEPREVLGEGGSAPQLVAFHPTDGRLFVVTEEDVRILEPASGRELGRWKPHQRAVTSLAFSADGARVATATFGDAQAAIWSTTTLEILQVLDGHSMGLYSIDFSPSGALVVTGSLDGTLRVWEARSGALVEFADLNRGNVVARFVDERRILVSTEIGGLLLWDSVSHRARSTWLGNERQASMLVDPRGQVAYSCDDSALRAWAFDTEDVRVLPAGEWCDAVSFDRTGHLVVNVGPDGYIRRWTYPPCQPLELLESEGSRWTDSSCHPAADELVAIDKIGQVQRWNLALGTRSASAFGVREPGQLSIAHAEIHHDPSGERLLRVSTAPSIEVLDSTTLEPRIRLQDPRRQRIMAARWFPDGLRVAAACADGRGLVFRVEDGSLERTWEPAEAAPPGIAAALAVHPDGRSIVLGYDGGTLVHWTLGQATPAPWAREQGLRINALRFHPDGSLLVVGSGPAVEIWDVAHFERIVSLHGHSMPVTSLSFSPDGRTLVSSSHDGTIRLWETRQGRSPVPATGTR